MNRAFSILVFISFCFLISSCKKEKAGSDSNAKISHPQIEYYFPVQVDSLEEKPFVFQEKKLIPDFNNHYSSVLKIMKEPNFLKKRRFRILSSLYSFTRI